MTYLVTLFYVKWRKFLNTRVNYLWLIFCHIRGYCMSFRTLNFIGSLKTAYIEDKLLK